MTAPTGPGNQLEKDMEELYMQLPDNEEKDDDESTDEDEEEGDEEEC